MPVKYRDAVALDVAVYDNVPSTLWETIFVGTRAVESAEPFPCVV